jgi:hypothetical protein
MLSDSLFEITLMLEEAMKTYDYHVDHHVEFESIIKNLFTILIKLDYEGVAPARVDELVETMTINFLLNIHNKV